MQGFCFSAGVNRRAERAAQKTEDLSALCFYFRPKKYKSLFWELVWFCFFVHPLVAYRLQKHSRCTRGLKDQQCSPFSSHTFCWSHLRFSVFLSNTIQWVLRHFLKERKEQSIILCNNNNKKNYRPLSRKKGKKVSLRISVRWPAEAAGVSVNTHWRRAWELQQHPLTEVPWVHRNTQRPSPGFDCQLC